VDLDRLLPGILQSSVRIVPLGIGQEAKAIREWTARMPEEFVQAGSEPRSTLSRGPWQRVRGIAVLDRQAPSRPFRAAEK
jgi:hypothetical protein